MLNVLLQNLMGMGHFEICTLKFLQKLISLKLIRTSIELKCCILFIFIVYNAQ